MTDKEGRRGGTEERDDSETTKDHRFLLVAYLLWSMEKCG